MDIEIKNIDGVALENITVPGFLSGIGIRSDILHRVVRWQMAKRQAGTHKTLTRAEVARTGKKLYKQKGTGRARHGSARVTQFRGGGNAFGPVVRSHAHNLPKKVRVLGLKVALMAKLQNQSLILLDTFALREAKSKLLKEKILNLGLNNALFIDVLNGDSNFQLAARNLKGINCLPVEGINVYDILKYESLVLSKAAFDVIEARLS
jgi:large subunit ribosomal protein L4